MSPINLESRISAVNVDDWEQEHEDVVAECFQYGFFPWDNPKFQVILIRALECHLRSGGRRRSVIRGWMYASAALERIQGNSDYLHLANQIEEKLREPPDYWPCLTIPEVIGHAQAAYDRRLARSLRRAQKQASL